MGRGARKTKEEHCEEIKERANTWNLSIKIAKLTLGVFLVALSTIFFIISLEHLATVLLSSGNYEGIFATFFADVLLVIIYLEVAKTLFTYVENEEMYLHSIMEAAFIAVLRQVIVAETHGMNWSDALGLSALILAMGFVYYRLFKRE